ncbi:MAG: hypothetical protein Kow00124_20060 [Anaerolineae bacterium]
MMHVQRWFIERDGRVMMHRVAHHLWLSALAALALAAAACSLPPGDLPATVTPLPEAGPSASLPAPGLPPTTPLPTTTTPVEPTSSPAPETLYRVVFVRDDDVLNVRSGPGASNPIRGMLAYNETGVRITGAGQPVGGSTWVPVEHNGLTGWVNQTYLTEQVDQATFCTDMRAEQLIADLRRAVSTGDGVGLARLVHPSRGLLIRHNWWNPEVVIPYDEVERFFVDDRPRDWGIYDGSGLPITGGTAEVIVPLLQRDLIEGAQVTCGMLLGGATAGLVILPPEYEALNFYSVYRPAPGGDDTFDWGTWAVGIEYHSGQPYLAYLIHYQWEI